MKGAGTDAQIFIQVYGEKGKSDEMKLESKSDSFEQGQCDKFMVLKMTCSTIIIIYVHLEFRCAFITCALLTHYFPLGCCGRFCCLRLGR